MNRIDKRFAEMKKKKEKALIGFISAGDPDPSVSLEILEAMCRAGIDVLELGIPFSDPTADGPVIQWASARALSKGVNLSRVLEITGKIRNKMTDIPIILFSYYNPIFVYGPESFFRDAVAAGADGVLVVDLPPEESRELTDCWSGGSEFYLIHLVAPTTTGDRMKEIADRASGFIYLVSKTGVTGSSGLDVRDVRYHVARLRSLTDIPICVGFGISDPVDAGLLSPHVDGVVIGSAFERIIEGNLDNPDLAKRLGEEVRKYKAAMCSMQKNNEQNQLRKGKREKP